MNNSSINISWSTSGNQEEMANKDRIVRNQVSWGMNEAEAKRNWDILISEARSFFQDHCVFLRQEDIVRYLFSKQRKNFPRFLIE